MPNSIWTMTVPPPPPRASLLGIPRELRRQIYDNVICLDINFCIERASPISTRRPQSLGERWDGACELPINKLALVCRAIASEVRSHALLLPPHQRVACIELCAFPLFLYGVHLSRLPCRIRQLSGLDLEIRLDMPHVLWLRNLCRWVKNKVADLSATILHLLEPEEGILKDATGIGDVRMSLHTTKSNNDKSAGVSSNEVEQEFRAQAQREIELFVRPRLGKRTLRLI